MFCGVITESLHTKAQKIIDICQVVMLKIRIFGVHIRQAAHLSGCALITVIIITDIVKSVCME